MTLRDLLLLLFTSNLLTFGDGRVMVPLLERALVRPPLYWASTSMPSTRQIAPGPANLYVAALGYMLYGPLGALLSVVVVVLPAYLIIPLHAGFRRLARNGVVNEFGRRTHASVGLIVASTVDRPQRAGVTRGHRRMRTRAGTAPRPSLEHARLPRRR